MTTPDQLRPPRNRIDRRAILLWTVNSSLLAVVILGGLAVVYYWWAPGRPWLGPVTITVAILLAVQILVMPTCRYLVHRWEFSDQAVYTLQGWLVRRWTITPISRIQRIDTVRGPITQLLGLSTLRVATASERGGIMIRGLNAETAAEAADRLTAITETVPGDAT